VRLAISVFAVAVTNKCTPTCAVIPYCNTRDFKTPFGSQRFVVVCGTNFEQQALLSSTWIKVCVCARACDSNASLNSWSNVVKTGRLRTQDPVKVSSVHTVTLQSKQLRLNLLRLRPSAGGGAGYWQQIG